MSRKQVGIQGIGGRKKLGMVLFHCLHVLILKNKEQLTIWEKKLFSIKGKINDGALLIIASNKEKLRS